MEVKINKEIREYTEAIFFGLSLRQCICSLLACGTAVAIYFIFRTILSKSVVSYLCMAGAVPFVLLGFVKYNGMTAEKIFMAWIRSEILVPKRLLFKPTNYYLEMEKQYLKNKNKKEKKIKNSRKKSIFKIFKFKKK